MTDSRSSFHDLEQSLNKRDLNVILEVNKKAIEIETDVADQNEEIISLLNQSKENQKELDDKIDKVIKQTDELSKDLFKIQVLFVTGILSLIIQVIQMFIKK
jgi:hypothetical protein